LNANRQGETARNKKEILNMLWFCNLENAIKYSKYFKEVLKADANFLSSNIANNYNYY
jgi:hypothetical protein